MTERRRSGINQLANALVGNTGTLARRQGFRDQSAGNASIASALLNRVKATDVQTRAGQREEGFNLIRKGGNEELLSDLLISDKINPQQVGNRRLAGQEFSNIESARGAIETGEPDLASQLNQLGSGKAIQRFDDGPSGPLNQATGELTNPELLASKTNLNNAKTEKNISFRDKADEEATQIAVKTQALVESGGKVPATGSAIANFNTKLLDVMSDPLKGGRLDVVEGKPGVKFKDLSPNERTAWLVTQRRILIEADPATQAKIMADLGIDELPLTPVESGEAGEAEDPGFFEPGGSFVGDALQNVFGGEPQQPIPLAPASQGPGANVAPTPTPAPADSLGGSLGPQAPIPPQVGGAGAPVLPELPVQQPQPTSLDGIANSGGPVVPNELIGDLLTRGKDAIARQLNVPQPQEISVPPATIRRMEGASTKNLQDLEFQLLSRLEGGEENGPDTAMLKAIQAILAERGDR